MNRRGVLGGLMSSGLITSGLAAGGSHPMGLSQISARAMAFEDDLVAQLLATSRAPGAGLAILDAAGARIAVAGRRVARKPTLVSRDDPWHLGSNTKSMTAVLAAQQVALGRLDWTSRLGEVRPDLSMDPAYRDVTLEALLRHATLLPANPPMRSLRDLPREPDLAPGSGREAYLDAALNMPPRDAPKYSNAGYVAAAAMIEVAAGARWEILVQRDLAGPLGLGGLGFGAPQGDVPFGHRRVLGLAVPVAPGPSADNVPAMAPAGGVHLPLPDMLRYLRAHLRRDPDLLPPEGWAKLHGDGSAQPMGWFRYQGRALLHSGSNTLWYQTMVIDQKAGHAVVASVNIGDVRRADKAMAEVYRRYLSSLA